MTAVSLEELRARFHAGICEQLLVLDGKGIASNADASQRTSRDIAAHIAGLLRAEMGVKLAAQTAGQTFETAVTAFIRSAFQHLQTIRPGDWQVDCINARSALVIARYQQYSHLAEVKRIADGNPELAVFVGNDYNVASDVVVSRRPLDDDAFEAGGLSLEGKAARGTPFRLANNGMPLMHASISCKWTMRSDRAQNSRFEALSLIRSRKGRVPHIAVVTGEPTPSRLASLALGTGDIDCVYHFALYELIDAVRTLGHDETENILNIMLQGNRLRDISDLPLDLAV